METNQLRIRIQRGEAVLELEGDSSTVINQLNSLKKEGIGKLDEFLSALPAAPPEHKPSPHVGKPAGGLSGPKDFPPLQTIAIKDLLRNETEWVLIYAYFASDGGKNEFSRSDLFAIYENSGRKSASRTANLTNCIRAAVNKDWLSVSGDTFTLLEAGCEEAKQIASREKASKKRTPKRKKKKATPRGKA